MRLIDRSFGLALAALLIASGTARSQSPIQLESPGGMIGLDFDGQWIDFALVPNSGRNTFREWVELYLRGAVFDPRLVSFDLGLRPTQAQTNWTGLPESPSGGVDRLDGYARVRLLSGAAVSLLARALRVTENNVGRLGAETDIASSEWGASLRYRNPYLPLVLDYTDRSRDVTWRPIPQQGFREDQRTRTLRFTARNRKTSLLLERLSFDDRLDGRDFVNSRAYFDHTLRWGKRSQLASTFQIFDRSGFGSNRRVSWSQRAHLQHTWKVWSDYAYGIFSLRSGGGGFARGWNGDVSATYRVLTGLDISAEWYGQSTRFDIGRQSFHRVGPRLFYTASLPLDAYFTASVAAGYERHSQEPTAEGVVAVVDERHVIDATGRFTLNEPYVEPGSVVITSADGTTLYEDGFDYRLLQTDPFLEAVILPGGRLEPGDTVSVDYRRRILPAVDASAYNAEYQLNLRVAAFSVYHRRSWRNSPSVTGTAPIALLLSYDDQTTGIGLDAAVPRGSLNLRAEYRRRQSDTFDFENYILHGGLSFMLRRDLRGTLAANSTLQRGGTTPVDIFSGETALQWAATRSLDFRVHLSAWSWSEDEVREERFIGGGLGGELRIGLATLRLRYDRLAWVDGLDRTENRLLLGAVRRF